jgi:hypothetical protein
MSDPWGSPRLDSTVINRQYSNYVYKKVVVSGNLVEEYFYDEPLRINGGIKDNPNRKKKNNQRSEEYKGRSINIARNTIRRLVQANFGKDSKFLTLTLNNQNAFDITSIKECDTKFRLFIRSLRLRFADLKYLAVREFQTRGAVHYHLIVNLPFILNDDLANIWGHGFIKINEIDNVFGIGVYISKYLSKDFGDVRFKGVKTYVASRNLKRPVVYYGEEADSILKEVIKPKELPSFENSYKSVRNGYVYFSEYNLTQPILSEEKLNEIRSIFEKI